MLPYDDEVRPLTPEEEAAIADIKEIAKEHKIAIIGVTGMGFATAGMLRHIAEMDRIGHLASIVIDMERSEADMGPLTAVELKRRDIPEMPPMKLDYRERTHPVSPKQSRSKRHR